MGRKGLLVSNFRYVMLSQFDVAVTHTESLLITQRVE